MQRTGLWGLHWQLRWASARWIPLGERVDSREVGSVNLNTSVKPNQTKQNQAKTKNKQETKPADDKDNQINTWAILRQH